MADKYNEIQGGYDFPTLRGPLILLLRSVLSQVFMNGLK